MSAQPSLFPETAEERIQRIDGEILALLMGKPGGQFGAVLGEAERAVLPHIRYHRGAKNAITIREIKECTGLNERVIKDAVRKLRLDFRMPIGANRGDGGGYYLVVTREDLELFKTQYLGQIRQEFDVYRAIIGEQADMELIQALKAEAK